MGYRNFDNFTNTMLLLFRCSTGENWYRIMFDCIHAGSDMASTVLFFIFFILIVQFIMVQLFVLVILQQFEENFMNPDNLLTNFKELAQDVQEEWTNQTAKWDGIKIHEKQLTDFYLQLKEPLGLGKTLAPEHFHQLPQSRPLFAHSDGHAF